LTFLIIKLVPVSFDEGATLEKSKTWRQDVVRDNVSTLSHRGSATEKVGAAGGWVL